MLLWLPHVMLFGHPLSKSPDWKAYRPYHYPETTGLPCSQIREPVQYPLWHPHRRKTVPQEDWSLGRAGGYRFDSAAFLQAFQNGFCCYKNPSDIQSVSVYRWHPHVQLFPGCETGRESSYNSYSDVRGNRRKYAPYDTVGWFPDIAEGR